MKKRVTVSYKSQYFMLSSADSKDDHEIGTDSEAAAMNTETTQQRQLWQWQWQNNEEK